MIEPRNGNADYFVESPTQRRLAIRDYISRARRTSIARIANDFGVSTLTVKRDLQALNDPGIVILRGRNKDSVRACDGWYSNCKLFKPSQVEFIRDLCTRLPDEDDRKRLLEILNEFAPHVSVW